jgi:hypothetical protein
MPVKTILSEPGPTAPDYGQWNNQIASAALKGKIYNIVIEPNLDEPGSGGTGYDPLNPPLVTISGDGAGATAVAVVNASSPYNITKINVTNSGTSPYNVVYVTIADPVSGITARARAILSPSGTIIVKDIDNNEMVLSGHGTDAVKELGGFYVGIKTSLRYSEDSGDPQYGNFITDGSFRQLGIVKNPYELGTTDILSQPTYSALKYLRVSTPSNIVSGDYINSSESGAIAFIDSWESAAEGGAILKYHQNDKTGYKAFTTGIFTTNSGGSGTIDSIHNQEVERFSGKILFLENRKKIDRSSTQIEDIKLVIEF